MRTRTGLFLTLLTAVIGCGTVGFVSAQVQDNIHELLIERYGDKVEWVVRDGVITLWKPKVDERDIDATKILKPTPLELASWGKESSFLAKVKAAHVDPNWRALIAAICLMTECEDEDAAWAAFLAALP